MKRTAPVIAALVVLLLVAWWPFCGAGNALGHPVGDFADHYWGTWWFGSELLAGRWPDTTTVSLYPAHQALWYVDPLGALLALPLRVLGFPTAWNLLLFGQALLAGLAAWWTATRLTSSATAGLVGGVIVGASPYALGLGSSGLAEYLGLATVVLYCWWSLRALGQLGEVPRRAALYSALFFALCTIQAFYYSAFAALWLGVAALLSRHPDRWKQAARIAVMAAVPVAPWLRVAGSTLTASNAAVSAENAPGWTFATLPTTDLLTFFRPGAYYYPDLAALGNPGIVHVNYLGWTALVLALLGARGAMAAPPFQVDARVARPAGASLSRLAIAWFVLGLGPVLCIGGYHFVTMGMRLPLPLALLYSPSSPFRMVHHPYRLVAFLLPLLAWLAAMGARRLPPWARILAAGLFVAEAVLISPARWPFPNTDIRAPAVYSALGPGPVLDWPPDATEANRRYVVWQVEHGRPNAYGVNTFLVDEVRASPTGEALLDELQNVNRRAMNRDVRLPLPELETGPDLDELGYCWLVAHRDALNTAELEGTIEVATRRYGDPIYDAADALAWAIPCDE